MFDPRVEEFHEILDEQESFPVGEFLHPTVLAVLQTLGLQSAITLSSLVECAKVVANDAKVANELLVICGNGELGWKRC